MPSEIVNQKTRLEWRDLGFYYDRDDSAQEWRLTGSRNGLLQFRDLLLTYANDPRHAGKSEHEHYGPYQYLEIMTWPEAGMDDHAIHGALDDLRRLASLVDQELTHARAGVAIRIRGAFATDSKYALVLDVRPDDFDPSAVDPALATRAG